ncbi:hypothetical protein Y023_5929 [Burkholderia pseudomallei A79D]|nr:hypothetical protein Y023_5929 [Burkholderia pseudomallei A79D]KGX94652.1 hypothetical protein X997_5777 [Burkholderia pseudomallei A79C]
MSGITRWAQNWAGLVTRFVRAAFADRSSQL